MATELTKIIANFSTQITTNVSAGGTSVSLASNLDKEGNALPAGKYCLTLNQGKSNEQHFKCDLSGTSITNVVGISHAGVESAGFLKDARINDEVKLTDYVNLLRIVEILSGSKALDGGTPIKYDAAPALTNDRQIPDKGYTDAAIAVLAATISGKADKAGNNIFTGNNTFTQPIVIPDALNANEAVTLSQLMAAALGGVSAGLNYFTVQYRKDGRPRSIHDSQQGVTYVFGYHPNGSLVSIYNGTQKWLVNRSLANLISVTR